MMPILWVAAGGAVGASLRYLIAVTMAMNAKPGQWPLSTLLVNVGGSLAIGISYALIVERGVIDPQWRPLLITGFLGGLTTFSTFSLEAVLLLDAGRWTTALAYAVVSAMLCIAAAGAGLHLTRLVAS